MADLAILDKPSYMEDWDQSTIDSLSFKKREYSYKPRQRPGDIVTIRPDDRPLARSWIEGYHCFYISVEGLDYKEALRSCAGGKTRPKTEEEIQMGRIEVDLSIVNTRKVLEDLSPEKIDEFDAKVEWMRQEMYEDSDNHRVPEYKFRASVDIAILMIDASGDALQTAPNPPQNLTAEAVAGGKIKLNWFYSTFNQAVNCDGFHIYMIWIPDRDLILRLPPLLKRRIFR